MITVVHDDQSTGTATMTVTVPEPGILTAMGPSIASVAADSTEPEALHITITAVGAALTTEQQNGKKSVEVALEFDPAHKGARVHLHRTVKLLESHSARGGHRRHRRRR